MKKRKTILIIVSIILLLLIGGFVVYKLMSDENKLSVSEKKYITENSSKLINVNVKSDLNVFAKSGSGVYFDFLKSEMEEDGLSLNITSTDGLDKDALTLTKGNKLPKNSKLFYTDHYVLVSKKYKKVTKPSEINGTIGITNYDRNHISNNIGEYSLTTKNYDSKEDLLKGFENDEVDFIIVPRIDYIDFVLNGLYSIIYHFSDIKDYYYINASSDSTLNSIIYKYYNKWYEKNLEKSFNRNEYDLFVKSLRITEKDLDTINSKIYNYGFVNKFVPYDIKSSKTFGGINNVYLSNFTKFSGIKFNYKAYRSFNELKYAISKGDVNLFFNYYDYKSKFSVLDSSYNIVVSFIMNDSDSRSFTTLNSLKNQEVYVKENSLIATFLKQNNIDVKFYKNDNSLNKLLKKNKIVAMDRYSYLAYQNNAKVNISERVSIDTDLIYHYNSNNDTTFNKLFSYYISSIDKNDVIYTGLDNSLKTVKSGTIIYQLSKYAFVLIFGIVLFSFVSYKYGKKVHIRKKIKKADKIKYMDMMTSLKNRNFLSENISVWNQNTIYPQAIIVIDLNNIQNINDSYGYDEGDKQIKAAANVLIKTQLDNSEIMRSDGNEFTIYLVGYSEKKLLSYIKKLNKEFKNLPYNNGVALGFSIIEDDLKLVDDAINEATEKMKQNKTSIQEEKDESKN